MPKTGTQWCQIRNNNNNNNNNMEHKEANTKCAPCEESDIPTDPTKSGSSFATIPH
ncbi:uncharacterized protein CPUR_07939 [Claviceps purpurea 20.1]|uniref:Uncharacterized protein n=1 Tax=Claviceps purpurea (strain 20.1) TaxID=1111077 RepID=M1WFW9_CLAP2|nr:uncharacterized protein CPUR_07939 [Claviceps purpurea 20.1]